MLGPINGFIASSIDILMFNFKYLALHKVQMWTDAISKLLYGFASVQAIIHYCKFGNFRNGFSFGKLRNGEITLLFTYIGKSCHSQEFLTSQICILMLLAKIKFSRKFSDLLYKICHLISLTLISHHYFLY